ncbi:glycosyltransferase family 4 protein [Mucilaginibacter sp. SP1R1]|uniref:glycosyltransferase family 4 protein n=1 Tax=Mucilaginibacter sp. SP1R1 TaxID=2723091 RepID=UPI00160C692E|nr:glycosyltransferase family 1 protein [Mucilaginibacter sp. SP1R1]MBB6152612.1 glycosyltransferase involved in cell wall biosynthesis [Mucilaginibacter sp. SP1R1]
MTKRYKIAINATILDEKPSGLGVVTLNIINNLQQYLPNVDIDVYSSTKAGLNSNINVKEMSKLLQPSRFKKVAGFYRFYWNQVSLYFISKKYDLVYSTTPHGSVFIKNQIITVHDLISIIPNKTYKSYSLQGYYYKLFLKKLVDKSLTTISVSNKTKDDVVQYLNVSPDKIQVVHNGYNKESFNPENEFEDNEYTNSRFILTIGATLPHKNIDRLLNAFKQVKDNAEFSDLKLYILGGKEAYMQALTDRAKELNLESDIIIKRYVPMREITCAYKYAQCFVYPSLYEGFGLPVIEAMACGCPVICAGSSSLPEVAGDAALFFDPLNEAELYERIMQLITNKALATELVAKGYNNIKRFDWNESAKLVATIFMNNLKKN